MTKKSWMIVLLAIVCALTAVGCGERIYIQYPEYKLEHSFISEYTGDNTYLVCHVRLEDRYITLNDVLKLTELFGKTNYSKYGTVQVLFFGPGDYADAEDREGTVASAIYGPGGSLSGIGTDKKVGVGTVKMIQSWANGPTAEEFEQYNTMAQIMRDYKDLETEEIMEKVRAAYGMEDEEIQELFYKCIAYMTPTTVSGYGSEDDTDDENSAE